MILNKIKTSFQVKLRNLKGWRTERHIIVIESDDWGSIRMPSREVYDKLLKAGIKVDHCPYNRFDSLESNTDLEELFNILREFTDSHSKHPVITANVVTCNPDFLKIRASNFKEYYYELYSETLKRYSDRNNTLAIWQEGIAEKLVFPQFHGREHLNVNRWMKALQLNLPETRLAFDNELFGLSTNITNEKRRSYLAAFDFDNKNELADHKKIITEGLEIFSKMFGYKSETFIASNYIWHSMLEETLAENGVNYIQGLFAQREPVGDDQNVKSISHPLGDKNKYGQIYLTRNALFEPAMQSNADPLTSCLNDIVIAFRWRKPAIISSHRLNYIGSIVRENRDQNLKLLHNLIKQILQRWKDVEFMTSDQLGAIIRSDISRN